MNITAQNNTKSVTKRVALGATPVALALPVIAGVLLAGSTAPAHAQGDGSKNTDSKVCKTPNGDYGLLARGVYHPTWDGGFLPSHRAWDEFVFSVSDGGRNSWVSIELDDGQGRVWPYESAHGLSEGQYHRMPAGGVTTSYAPPDTIRATIHVDDFVNPIEECTVSITVAN